jgi:HAMP domain-containing protein
MTEAKKRRGSWKPGQSGNPAGRPPGVGEIGKLRAAIGERVPELLAAMMTKALEGDVGAARLLLDRAIAPLKAAEQTQALSLPIGTLTEQGRAVLASVASGELAPGQGAALVSAIGTLARVTEIDDLAKRIERLEAHHGNT